MRVYLSISFLIFITTACLAQSGEIRGMVVDKQTKAPLAYATITVALNDTIVAGAQSDKDGYYSIKPLMPGRYNVKGVLDNYQPALVKEVSVVSDGFSDITLEMRRTKL